MKGKNEGVNGDSIHGERGKTESGNGERAGPSRRAPSFPFQFHVLVLRRANSSEFLSPAATVPKWFRGRSTALDIADKDLPSDCQLRIVRPMFDGYADGLTSSFPPFTGHFVILRFIFRSSLA